MIEQPTEAKPTWRVHAAIWTAVALLLLLLFSLSGHVVDPGSRQSADDPAYVYRVACQLAAKAMEPKAVRFAEGPVRCERGENGRWTVEAQAVAGERFTWSAVVWRDGETWRLADLQTR